jgi:hypothetical protein
MKLQFIKSKLQMATELHTLWDNKELYKFIKGKKYIRQCELDICECLTNDDRDNWIEVCRIVWLQRQLELEIKKSH